MKKFLIVSIALLVLLILLMPAVVGISAENQFRRIAANLENAAPEYRLVVDGYERGWFSSRARYHLELSPQLVAETFADGESAVALPSLHSEARILHGPIFFAGIGEPGVSLVPALAHSIDTLTVIDMKGEKTPVPGAVSTRLGFLGRHLSVVALDTVDTTFAAGEHSGKLNWAGMGLEAQFNSALDEAAFDGQIGGVELEMPTFRLATERLRLDGNQRLTEYGFWAGEQSGGFGGFSINTDDARRFSVGDTSWSANISVADGAVNQHAELSVESVATANWQAGPVRLLISIDGLDAVAIGALIDNREALFAAENGDSSAGVMNMFGFVEELLSRGSEADLRELSVVTPDGVLSLRAQIRVPDTEQGTLASMLANLDASASLRIPASLAGKLAELNPEAGAKLDGLIAAGLLLTKEDMLVMDVALKGALLTVNGQPMPLPMPL